MGALGWILRGGTALTGVMAGPGAVAVGENYIRGKDSFTRSVLKETFAGIGESQRDAENEVGLYGIYKIGEMLAELIESFAGKNSFSEMIYRWSDKGMNKERPADATSSNGRGRAASDFNTVTVSNERFSQATYDADVRGDIVGATTALGTAAVASFAAPATVAAMGIRGVPVLGAVFAAADAVGDVAGYAWNGNYRQAGVRALSGAVETIGMTGGFMTGAFGIAGRELVEEAGAGLLGEQARVPDSPLVSLGKQGLNYLYK